MKGVGEEAVVAKVKLVPKNEMESNTKLNCHSKPRGEGRKGRGKEGNETWLERKRI